MVHRYPRFVTDGTAARDRMVREQIERRGVSDSEVLAAMRRVPRERFVPPDSVDAAFDDGPMSIGSGQTISQPYIVALMAAALRLKPGARVLEVGAGSGYGAAVLAEVVGPEGFVRTIDRIEALARAAEARLRDLGYANVRVALGDGSNGLPAFAPFDGVSVTAAAPDVPPPLLDQLADGGRLVAPIGDRFVQDLVVVERRGRRYDRRVIEGVRFVPLVGAHGYAP